MKTERFIYNTLTTTIIFFLVVLLYSCQEEPKNSIEKNTSDFSLIEDMYKFKQLMTEQDTIRITFNHSSCMWHAYERLEISKESDSLKIISWYLNLTDDINNTNWEKIYEKKILQNDTSWKFSEFLKRNNNRRFQEEKRHVHLFMTDQKDTVRYFTKGLSEINHFSSDYYETMRKIYFDNETGYYGYVVD